MNKQQELQQLDDLLRGKMIGCLDGGDMSILKDLSPIVMYLSKNNTVAEKKLSSVEEDIAKRLEEAEKRRKNK